MQEERNLCTQRLTFFFKNEFLTFASINALECFMNSASGSISLITVKFVSFSYVGAAMFDYYRKLTLRLH